MGVAGGPRTEGNEDLVFVVDALNNKSSISTDTRCAYFDDASSQYVSGSSTTLNELTGSCTYGCWFYTDDLTIYQQLMSKFGNSQNQSLLQFDKDSNFIYWYGSDNGTGYTRVSSDVSSISSATWHLAIGTFDFDLGTLNVSVDAQPFNSASFTGPLFSGTGPLGMGAQLSGVQPLSGRLDIPFVYNKALDITDVGLIYNSGTGIPFEQFPSQSNIVSAWPLTETGDERRDTYGDCDMLYDGGATYGPGHVSKSAFYYTTNLSNRTQGTPQNGVTLVSGSWEFDGTDDYVEFGNILGEVLRGETLPYPQWTQEFWIYPRSTVTGIVAGHHVSFDDWFLYTLNNDIGLRVHRGDNTAGDGVSVGDSVPINTWTHVVVQWDGTQTGLDCLTIYANGIDVSPVSGTGTNWDGSIDTSTDQLVMGKRGSTITAPWNGRLGSYKIYNRRLTSQEVLTNYNRHKDKFV